MFNHQIIAFQKVFFGFDDTLIPQKFGKYQQLMYQVNSKHIALHQAQKQSCKQYLSNLVKYPKLRIFFVLARKNQSYGWKNSELQWIFCMNGLLIKRFSLEETDAIF